MGPIGSSRADFRFRLLSCRQVFSWRALTFSLAAWLVGLSIADRSPNDPPSTVLQQRARALTFSLAAWLVGRSVADSCQTAYTILVLQFYKNSM